MTIEILHIQATTLRGLLHRARSLLNTVQSADQSFISERDACVRDLEQWQAHLLKRMQETSPALTRHYADSASGDSNG